MTVVVAAITPNSFASQALDAEGVKHVEHVCEGEFGYGQMMADYWRKGEGFVLIEHDVVPWVGAVEKLQKCPSDWCSLPYARSGSTMISLGAVKFSTALVKSMPPETYEPWAEVSWRELDGRVLTPVHRMHRNCKHSPAAGHIRRPDR